MAFSLLFIMFQIRRRMIGLWCLIGRIVKNAMVLCQNFGIKRLPKPPIFARTVRFNACWVRLYLKGSDLYFVVPAQTLNLLRAATA